jgi:hypothetical protein
MKPHTLFEHDFIEYHCSDPEARVLERLNHAYGEPVLQATFHDGERLRAVVGKSLVEQFDSQVDLFEAAADNFDGERKRVDIRHFENDDAGFLAALRQIYAPNSAKQTIG